MDFVKDLTDLLVNAKTLDSYLASSDFSEKDFAIKLIRKGVNFIVIERHDGLRFYPSRFMGYKGNSINSHSDGKNKHIVKGGKTDNAISEILGSFCTAKETVTELQSAYSDYCSKLNCISDKRNHKFWEKITL